MLGVGGRESVLEAIFKEIHVNEAVSDSDYSFICKQPEARSSPPNERDLVGQKLVKWDEAYPEMIVSFGGRCLALFRRV